MVVVTFKLHCKPEKLIEINKTLDEIICFTHIFFSLDKLGERTFDAAAQVMTGIRAAATPVPEPRSKEILLCSSMTLPWKRF